MSDTLDSRLILEFNKKLHYAQVRNVFQSCFRNNAVRVVWQEIADYHGGTVLQNPKSVSSKFKIKQDGVRFEGYFLAGMQAYFAIPCVKQQHSFYYEKMLFKEPEVDDFTPPDWPEDYFGFVQYIKNTLTR